MMNPPRIGFGNIPDRNISGSMWRYNVCSSHSQTVNGNGNVAGVLSQHQHLGTDLGGGVH